MEIHWSKKKKEMKMDVDGSMNLLQKGVISVITRTKVRHEVSRLQTSISLCHLSRKRNIHHPTVWRWSMVSAVSAQSLHETEHASIHDLKPQSFFYYRLKNY